jgi:multiple sugar transport system permease protein
VGSATAGPTGGPTRTGQTIRRGRARARRLFIAPLAVLLGTLTLIPTAYILIVSFTNAAATNHQTGFVGFQNYVEMFSDPNYWIVLFRTVVFVVIAVAFQLAIGLAAAVAVSTLTRSGALVRALILLPMAAAPVATYFNWQQILNTSTGPLNYLLGLVGLPQPDWLGQQALALPTLMAVDTWQWTPFVFIILAGGLATIPRELHEAAAVDGANGWQRFSQVTLPLLMPYIAVAVLFRGIDALKTFDSVQILTSGGPGSSTTMLNYSIFQQGISFLEFGKASASAVVFLIICTLLANVLLRGLSRTERA